MHQCTNLFYFVLNLTLNQCLYYSLLFNNWDQCLYHFLLFNNCVQVLCGKCCCHKASLACEGGRMVKVCKDCLPHIAPPSLSTPPDSDGGPAAGGSSSSRYSSSSSAGSRVSGGTEGADLYRTRGVLEVSSIWWNLSFSCECRINFRNDIFHYEVTYATE